ncbi:MAG TPA: ATP-binding protein [bacterium]|nr:ATP-binding protein [bacterium]HPR86518.1 ATP-binding protein [bacterium]
MSEQAMEAQTLNLPDAYLMQAEKMGLLSILTPGFAHDAGTPLMGITAITQVLKEKIDDPGVRQSLGQIEQAVDRLTQILRTIVDSSRPIRPDRQKVYLNSLILETVRMVQHDRRLKYREVRTELTAQIPQVLASADQLLLVLLALCINAAEALEADPAGYLLLQSWQEEGRVLVAVKDNGAGIASELMPHLFTPGFTTRQGVPGRGLGLYVCRAILTAHSGKIAVASEPGKGTTVTLALPALESGQEE